MRDQKKSIFDVMTECSEFLSWLHVKEGISIKQMPERFKDECKQLSKLGIVYRRNNRSLGIKWQRIRRLLARRGTVLPLEKEELLSRLVDQPMPAN